MSIIPGVQVPQGLSIQPQMKQRVPRRPQHTFNIEHRPFEIQPFMIAPVLPGETMKNALLQSRAVTDNIVDPLIGWWLEHYFFYVPLRACAGSQIGGVEVGSPVDQTTIESMLLDISAPLAANNSALPYAYSSASGSGYDWVSACLKTVVANYFRDEGEAVSGSFYDFGAGSPPLAKFVGNDWSDSLYDITTLGDTTIDQTPTADISMEDLDGKYTMWQILRSQKMTEMTFDDYLETFGVKTRKAGGAGVELIRQIKSWTYPANTINPADVLDSNDDVIVAAGSPSSVCSWSVKESSDKDRLFKEPGFIFGVTIARPKMYLYDQVMSASSNLTGALDWMPAILKERVDLSVRKFAETAGIVPSNDWSGNGYWLDIRDLFMYGDQFLSDPSTTNNLRVLGLSAGGNTNARKTYINTADANGLFVTSALNKVKQDGVVHLNILGTQMDHT